MSPFRSPLLIQNKLHSIDGVFLWTDRHVKNKLQGSFGRHIQIVSLISWQRLILEENLIFGILKYFGYSIF